MESIFVLWFGFGLFFWMLFTENSSFECKVWLFIPHMILGPITILFLIYVVYHALKRINKRKPRYNGAT